MSKICANPKCQHHVPMPRVFDDVVSYYGPVNSRGEQTVITVRRFPYFAGDFAIGFPIFHLCETCHSAVQFVKSVK